MALELVNGFKNIYQIESFEEEFEETTSERNTSGRYHKWLRRSLALLEHMGYGVLKLPSFEKLVDTNPNLYSIRNTESKKNPRVLFAFFDGTKVILLLAFKEKNRRAG